MSVAHRTHRKLFVFQTDSGMVGYEDVDGYPIKSMRTMIGANGTIAREGGGVSWRYWEFLTGR